MAVARAEDQVFFIYDHTRIKCESDDLKDAIVYFFPSSVGVNAQCALVGQLMGMVDFFKSFTGSPPSVFTLHRNKVAIKHLGKYSLALAGNRGEPDGVVLTQLHYLHKLFVLYQGSLQLLEQRACQHGTIFSEVTQDIWDCYLPFIRRYGDNIAAAFESLPVVDLPETGSTLFLKASHLLQKCQKESGSLAGCLLYKNRVLCSQFHPDVTARLLILRPRQTHFPCIFQKTDVNPPPDIRLLKIFLTYEERDFITGGQNTTTRSSHNPQKSHNVTIASNKPVPNFDKQSLTDVQKDRRRMRSDQSHGRKYGSVDWNNTIQEFKSLARDTADLGCNTDSKELVEKMTQVSEISAETRNDNSMLTSPTTHIHKSRSESELVSSTENTQLEVVTEENIDQLRNDVVVPSYGRQVSQESNILCVENDSAEMKVSSPKVDLSVSNAASRSNSAPGCRPQKYRNNNAHSNVGNTMSLLQNIKRIAAQSRNILEDINRKMDLNSDMKDSDDDVETNAGRFQNQSGLTNELGDVVLAEECTEQFEGDNGQKCNLSSRSDQDQVLDDAAEVEKKSDKDFGMSLDSDKIDIPSQKPTTSEVQNTDAINDLSTLASIGQDFEHISENDHLLLCDTSTSSQNHQLTESVSGGSLASDSDLKTQTSPTSTSGQADVSCYSELMSDLCDQDLFVQSGCDVLLVLLMEKDQLKDGHLVNNIWRTYTPQLKELENQLQQISDAMASKKEMPTTYNYLTYNSYTKNLSGKISMTRGMLQPMSHHELDFCGTAVAMHQQFSESRDLSDMTLRSHSSFVYGHRNLSQEMYFQPKECKPPTGIPSARDMTMCLDARTGLALLRDQGIHLI